jgi:uncharacterized protein YceK
MRTALHASVAGLVILLTGCGSIGARWQGNREPYAGVKLNVETVKNYHTEGELISALDLPFSAILDTFLLPYDLSGDKPEEEIAPTEPDPAPEPEVSAQR